MPSHADRPGVRTWYHECGSGGPLVLQHPGLADARAFDPNLMRLPHGSTSSRQSGAGTGTPPTSMAR
ncbi:MAG: hypothetical protein ACREF4_17215 [Gammaproteobacteria bacterium]